MTRWRRPYRDPESILMFALPIGGCVIIAIFAATTIAQWPDVSVPYTLMMGLFFAVALPYSWRMPMIGLVISDEGVRLRWLLLTRTVAWSDITEFQTQGKRMTLQRYDGTSMATPIMRGNRSIVEYYGGRSFRPDQYEMLLADLNRRLRERDFTVGQSPQ